MTKGLAGFDRFITFLVGLVLLVVGVWATAWAFDVPLAHEIGAWYDDGLLKDFFWSSGFVATLGAIAVLGIILGLWWMIANFRTHSFDRVKTTREDQSGQLSLTTRRIADSINEDIEKIGGVEKTRRTVREDRKQPTLDFYIQAQPTTDMALLLHRLNQADRDFHSALPDNDVATRYRVHLQPVDNA